MPPVVTTAAGRPVCLSHFGSCPAPSPAPAGTTISTYTHFDMSFDELNTSARYNCWGFTFIPRRYCICDELSVDYVLEDNCIPVADGSVEQGDIIRYRNSGITTHTGRVWETDGSGHATIIRSKWGRMQELFHPPLTVPVSYGSDTAYFRQNHPLNGVADLWIRDSPTDDGEQFSHNPWWTSPDILVDVSPYDSIPDPNPKFSQVNRIWTRIQNRSDLAAPNVYVRYYWADPAAGLPPAAWNLIPGTPAHPNPAGPFAVPGHGIVDAPYVEWTPTAAPAHQCLLAIAYVNDDPADSDNPDPIVYPFDVPWENNVGQRNVHIINPGKKGSLHKLSIGIANPFPHLGPYDGEIQTVLTQATHLPLLSPSGKMERMPDIQFNLNKKTAISIKPATAVDKNTFRTMFRRPPMHPSETPLAMKNFTDIRFDPKKPQTLDMDITIPDDAKPGSIYYLHILQKSKNQVMGGYTVVITVKEPEPK
ncbi:MAG: hypothetical protein Q7T80_06505 [Methanoregula sp.]|nr:hypothetical protein [Methanoregula sp.]